MGEVWCTCWVFWAEVERKTAIVVGSMKELCSVSRFILQGSMWTGRHNILEQEVHGLSQRSSGHCRCF